MLKKINEGRVESNEGFSIHIIGLETLKYEENDRFIILDWTYNLKLKKITIYVSDALYWDGLSKERLTAAEKSKLINNISRAVTLLEGSYEVV